MKRSTRRELIAALGATAAATAVPPAWGARLLSRRPAIGPGDFEDGVASGEPSGRAVTFWSRIRTERPASGAQLIVARDPELREVVASQVVPTGRAVNGALKARVGGLEPASEYWYAWESGTDVSPTGRTRTRPPHDSAQGLRFAFSSCQNYGHGFYRAHANAVAEDLDLYIFLGDYIYERRRAGARAAFREDPIMANDLGSYRRKYQLYRSDPDLRELHRLHPIVHIWDDHEVANNYSDNDPPPAPLQRAAGYRAAFEWLPRMSPATDRHRIYKKMRFGSTAGLWLLDERQYRTGDFDGQPRRILGDGQMQWLIDGLRQASTRWKIVAQQVVVAPIGGGNMGDEETDPSDSTDNWDGYPADRARLLGEIERAGVENVVFLTGDAHIFLANLLASDFAALGDGSSRRPAAVEYVGGAVTSPRRNPPDPATMPPWNRQYNGVNRGYAVMGMDQGQLVTEYRASDVSSPAGGTVTFERFTQPAGANNFSRESFG